MSVVQKGRYWAFVAYPESLPDDWIDILISKGLPFAVSPLHNHDLDPTGIPKKAHYHVILCFDGPTTFNNVKSITDYLNQPFPLKLESVRGYYRYFTHKDNPDKYQYSESDIRHYNGFSPSDYSNLTQIEIRKLRSDIIDFIIQNNIYEYADLVLFVQDLDPPEIFDFVSTHTLFFKSFIDSRRHSSLNKK